MEENKKKFNFGNKMYKPPTMTQKDMEEGMKRAFQSKREIKPLNITGQQRKPETPKFDIGMKKQDISLTAVPNTLSPEKPKSEPQPYWSAEQWEEWAYQLYKNYPDTHEYLPDWFLEAMEED